VRMQLSAGKRKSGAFENAVKRVIIARRNRVELVIVAASAGNRQAEHATGQNIDAVVKFIGRRLGGVGAFVISRSQAEEAQLSNQQGALAVQENRLADGEKNRRSGLHKEHC